MQRLRASLKNIYTSEFKNIDNPNILMCIILSCHYIRVVYVYNVLESCASVRLKCFFKSVCLYKNSYSSKFHIFKKTTTHYRFIKINLHLHNCIQTHSSQFKKKKKKQSHTLLLNIHIYASYIIMSIYSEVFIDFSDKNYSGTRLLCKNNQTFISTCCM